ncbi:MAG: cation:proton antiporter [Armatimonadota bacterium]|nr:cation:proton antiporter [bacterium]MDW8320447.1 cation:proton antiporter [Armatimonadota bacterium]
MTVLGHPLFVAISATIIAALLGGAVAHRLRLPIIIGYISAGVLLGALNPLLHIDTATMHTVSEFGVALMMFVVGMELSLRDLLRSGARLVVAGGAQIVLSILLGYLLMVMLGWSWFPALIAGCVVAMSSTVVMIRLYERQGDVGSTASVLAMGVAITQDLALVILVGMLPVLADFTPERLSALGGTLIRSLLVLVGASLLATRIIPALLRHAVRWNSRELFILLAVGLCFGTALGTHVLGFSMALGAFLTGLIIGESEYSRQIVAEVVPIRDVFAIFFFVSLGMLIDPLGLASAWTEVLLLLVLIIVGKGLLITLLIRAIGFPIRIAVTVGLSLAQIGEFSFIITEMARAKGWYGADEYNVILTASVISLLLSPLLFALSPVISRWATRFVRGERFRQLREEVQVHRSVMRDHVILCGFGRVGSRVAQQLLGRKVPVVVIDLDPESIMRARSEGIPTIYGDAEAREVLELANPHTATIAILTMPESSSAMVAARRLKEINPRLTVLARTHEDSKIAELRRCGVDYVVFAEEETAKVIVRLALGSVVKKGEWEG